MSKKNKDKFKELAGDFKNEAKIEEEAEEEGLDLDKIEEEHFEDEQ
jgi:hypothetical protein